MRHNLGEISVEVLVVVCLAGLLEKISTEVKIVTRLLEQLGQTFTGGDLLRS